ncbi:MAG: FHA domain-containing protein [Anaerolineae bacterium]|nr:FHA domain-containing protein [Anaerolineae bacterium]
MDETKNLSPRDLPSGEEAINKEIDLDRLLREEREPRTVLMVFANNPRTLQFTLEESLTLGRRSEAGDQPDIDLAPFGAYPAGISRVHVRLLRQGSQVYVEDLGSRNGTFVEDLRLSPGEILPVMDGQAVRLGGLQGWIFYKNIK